MKEILRILKITIIMLKFILFILSEIFLIFLMFYLHKVGIVIGELFTLITFFMIADIFFLTNDKEEIKVVINFIFKEEE